MIITNNYKPLKIEEVMKKIIGFIAIAAVALVMAACSGGNSPSDVAKQAVKCIQDKDYEGYVDLMVINAKEGENVEEQKKAVADMLRSKAESTLDKKGGIKDYEIISETVAEDGKTANVEMKIVYGDGEVKNDTMKLRLDDAGDWRIDAGK